MEAASAAFNLQYFMMSLLDIKLLGLTALGTLSGIYIGAIPGLSVTMAVSILISFTFSWELNPALCLMFGIWTGGVYGGSRSSILLNIPGAPAAVATGFDGYPLAKLGEAGKAIGLSTTASSARSSRNSCASPGSNAIGFSLPQNPA